MTTASPARKSTRKPAAPRIPAAPRRTRHARRVEMGAQIGAVLLLVLAWTLTDHTAAMGANAVACVALSVLGMRLWSRVRIAIVRNAAKHAAEKAGA